MSVVASFPYGQSNKPACAGADTTWTGINDINEKCYVTYATTNNQMVPTAQAEGLVVGDLASLPGDNLFTGQNTFRNAASSTDAVLPTEFVTKGQVDATYAATGIVDLADDNIFTASQIFPTIQGTALQDTAPDIETTFQTLTLGAAVDSVVPNLICSSATDFPNLINNMSFSVPAAPMISENDVIFPAQNRANEGSLTGSWLYAGSGAFQLPDACPNPCTIVGDGAATLQVTLPQNSMVGTIINIINPNQSIQIRAPAGNGTLYNLRPTRAYTYEAYAYPAYFTLAGGVPLSVIRINESMTFPNWLIYSIQT